MHSCYFLLNFVPIVIRINIMKRFIIFTLVALFATITMKAGDGLWPDGTPISSWFDNTTKVDVETLGKKYVVTDYGVTKDSTIVQTVAIQAVIDKAAAEGGGVVVIPPGTFLSGALFFKSGTHLHLTKGATLKGSENIIDYPIAETRIEGQTCKYFTALINADRVNGFTITGNGTIDGNGLTYWQEFWIRRKWNPECTNKDAQRPRLVYISNSNDVTVQDVHLINSPFWTNHLYRCDRVRYIDCYIFAPTENIYTPEPKRGAPSSDAIDIDVCNDVLIHGCYMHVNDDAVVLKGGKGTWADKAEENGSNTNIIVQHCTYGKVHGCITFGSESIHDRNIILRNCHAKAANRVLWFKMRPDTPQLYEYVRIENITGECGSFLVIKPWTQFFQPDDSRPDMPVSQSACVTIRDIKMNCKNFFDVSRSDKYVIRSFSFENIDVADQANAFDPTIIENINIKNLKINGKNMEMVR